MKNIAVATTSRSDYGILHPLLREIDNDKELNLHLLVSGSHLSKEYGNTISEIINDGFKGYEIFNVLGYINSKENPQTLIMSNTINEFSNYFFKKKPDILVILGDRFETLGVAISAMLNKIPIAHIHGGEKTIGAIDDAIRHSITKLSHLHFVSCDEYKNRVRQLGENPNNIFSVGSLGVENISSIKLKSKENLQRILKIKNNKQIFLVAYHPTTISELTPIEEFTILLSALQIYKEKNIVFTGSNIDHGGSDINKLIVDTVSKNTNYYFFNSLGRDLFLNLMYHCEQIIGNSSSGIIEAPSFKKPVLNIGRRQEGRVMAKNILQVPLDVTEIRNAIDRASQKAFNDELKDVVNPYTKNNVSKEITGILKTFPSEKLLEKNFVDLI
ncbi:MAG: UDP-N-acetylglucosamine 2-epimerase (hydrolyzing) [Burkholderiaceae bacterium]|nr:MAG: UDP-N-acetylglucosamine 2-epimerase (hydrolyzing) [Burkholderiaceae bacterium]